MSCSFSDNCNYLTLKSFYFLFLSSLQIKGKDDSQLNLKYDDYFTTFDINKSPICFENSVKTLNKDIKIKLQIRQFFKEMRQLYWLTDLYAGIYINRLPRYKKVIV